MPMKLRLERVVPLGWRIVPGPSQTMNHRHEPARSNPFPWPVAVLSGR